MYDNKTGKPRVRFLSAILSLRDIKLTCQLKILLRLVFEPKYLKILPVLIKVSLCHSRSLPNGVHTMQLNIYSSPYKVYCHMTDIPGCGGGGWTLVMKVNGNMVR